MSEGEYISATIDENGVIKSQVFPELWLAVKSLIEGNLAEVLNVLQQGLSSSEHQSFISQLHSELAFLVRVSIFNIAINKNPGFKGQNFPKL